MPSGSRLAVGKPSLRPRPFPVTTTPPRAYGRPSKVAASSTLPLSSRLRIRVLLTGAPPPQAEERRWSDSQALCGSGEARLRRPRPAHRSARPREHYRSGLQLLHQQATEEFPRLDGREFRVELGDHYRVHALSSEDCELLLRCRQQRRRVLRMEEQRRVGSKVTATGRSPSSRANAQVRSSTR